jgi:hypothetical protein
MPTDDELVEQSQRRVEMGADDELDRWRVRKDGSGLRVVRKLREDALDTTVIDTSQQLLDENGTLNEVILDSLGHALGETRRELRSEWHKEISDEVGKLQKNLDALLLHQHDEINELKRRLEAQNIIIARLCGQIEVLRGMKRGPK